MYEDFRTGSKIRKIRTFWGGIRKSGKSARVGPLLTPGGGRFFYGAKNGQKFCFWQFLAIFGGLGAFSPVLSYNK